MEETVGNLRYEINTAKQIALACAEFRIPIPCIVCKTSILSSKHNQHAMLMFISIFVMLFVVVGLFSSNNTQITQQEQVNYKELIQKPKTVVIDVRTVEEFEVGHMPQTINIP